MADNNIFNQVQVRAPQYSRFDLSYDVKLSMKMGELVPVHIQETLPGDRFRMSSEAMFRMMPMIAPIMHKVDIFFHTFYCPNRLTWSNWDQFITGGQPGDLVPALPQIKPGDVAPSSLANYMGMPITTSALEAGVNALPFAAYQRIWYEFYRDQNLQDEPGVSLTDGLQSVPNQDKLLTMRRRAWEHDYFTSALPFAQKGDAVQIPFDGSGLTIDAVPPPATPSGFNPLWRDSATGSPLDGNPGGNADGIVMSMSATASSAVGNLSATSPVAGYYDPMETLIIQGTGSTTVNDLRTAEALQRWLEKAARAGSRYTESLLANFGVRSSDQTIQRPMYLGGSKATMAISEVLQTSSTDATTAQGNMAGHGISVSGGQDYTYRCEEHGYIITICSIRPKTAYYQGIPRHYMKQDRLDYAWPDFAQLGEQPVYKAELFQPYGGALLDLGTWGYLPRYAEYRFNQSRIVGQMASTLDFWHLGRQWDPALPIPPLNEDFIVCDPDKRIFAVDDPDEDEIVAHIFHKIDATRPLPKYGTPGIY